jgi:hypothetical protein
MRRVRSLAIALLALVLSGTSVFAFSALPDAASQGLQKATSASGQAIPARPASPAGPSADHPPVDLPSGITTGSEPESNADLPDAAAHGAAVSAVAKADDATPDTNHGADVSAVARDNHGTAAVAAHKPADAGKPDGAGKPTDPGRPSDPGAPDGAGRP